MRPDRDRSRYVRSVATPAKKPKAKAKAGKTVNTTKLRAKLLADPDTITIASNLGVPLEEYVDQVLHFVKNPKADPQMLVVEDDDLRAAGFEPPDEKKLLAFVEESVATLEEAGEVSGFKDQKKKKVDLGAKVPLTEGDEEVSSAAANPLLKEQISRELKRGRKR